MQRIKVDLVGEGLEGVVWCGVVIDVTRVWAESPDDGRPMASIVMATTWSRE